MFPEDDCTQVARTNPGWVGFREASTSDEFSPGIRNIYVDRKLPPVQDNVFFAICLNLSSIFSLEGDKTLRSN
jgi:hypothetical protein